MAVGSLSLMNVEIFFENWVLIFLCAIEKFEIPSNKTVTSYRLMVECTVQQPSYGSPYALDFFQSAIDTIHYALPFLRLNGDEARFSGHQLQTENGRGSCGGHTAEELYFLAGYSSAIRSHGQRIARRKSHCIYQ